MDIPGLLVLCLAALSGGLLPVGRWRAPIIAALSVAGLYWMQPASAIRSLDYWLPTIATTFAGLTWAVVRPIAERTWRVSYVPIAVLLGGNLMVGLLRYLGPFCCLTPTRPPHFWIILPGLLVTAAIAIVCLRSHHPIRISIYLMILVFAALILLKSDELARFSASLLRNMTGQDPSLASAIDLRWFGYSYLAFRLVGALREYHIGKRSDANLAEFLAYTLFFPAISAGPIDRLPRFLGDLRKSGESISMRNPARQIELQDGFTRLFWGIFKKFALADTLAIFALSAQSAAQLQSTPWSWVLLYAYALRIYYDFSGYTDIAIGLGLFLGIRLPDNFAAPYLQANLTSFWNAWHITLAQWFRAYYFNPLTRSLRSRQLPIPLIILFSQLTTMLLIGLWHGLTWNFAIWGIWHGTGLFVHNRWADWLKTRLEGATPRPATQKLIHLSGWILTFQFVTLSWVWFALPDPIMAMRMLARLFGLTI